MKGRRHKRCELEECRTGPDPGAPEGFSEAVFRLRLSAQVNRSWRGDAGEQSVQWEHLFPSTDRAANCASLRVEEEVAVGSGEEGVINVLVIQVSGTVSVLSEQSWNQTELTRDSAIER